MTNGSKPEDHNPLKIDAIKHLTEAQALEAKAIEDAIAGHPEKSASEAAAAIAQTAEAIEALAAEECHKEIHFFLDNERYETRDQHQTPNHIIKHYGERDPVVNYLVQFTDHGQISYEGKGADPIKIHNGAKFGIMCTGPATVSHGTLLTGMDLFFSGLRQLGFTPEVMSGKPDRVMFDYKIDTGSRAGQVIKHGFVVPNDFPLTFPSGPHVSIALYPVQSGGAHPTGGIHNSDFGDGWQYWSRPVPPQWKAGKAPVAAYMNHIWKLWSTQ